MDISEDKLINNALMFIYIRQNKTSEEKITNIENILNEGADINYQDSNNKNNTILHIAVQKDEKDIVQFLLKKGAQLLYNSDNKTPIHLAAEKKTVSGKEIHNIILIEGPNNLHQFDDSTSKKHQIPSNLNHSTPQNNSTDSAQDIFYLKRAGTSGVSGQFYESKLLSLVQHRALHDTDIDESYLAANIRDIGDFDDVCFRFKMKENGETKHIICFMQAKHKEDPDKSRLTVAGVRSVSGNFSMAKYYDSFLKVKQKFLSKTKGDPMFEGDFNDIECYFILYTPLKESFDRKLTGNKPMCPKLDKFIYTGNIDKKEDDKKKEEIFQFNYEQSDILFLTEFMQHERIKVLGKVFLSFILSNKTNDIMTNDLIQIYHPALAQNVIKLSPSTDPNYFSAEFRSEFLKNTEDDKLMTLKEILFREIVFYRTKKKTGLFKKDVKDKIKQISEDPSAENISTLIGEVIFFDEKSNKLCLNMDKISRKEYEQKDIREINQYLKNSQVTLAMVNKAIEITGEAKLKLLSSNLKLPLTFGNTDFPSFIKDKTLLKGRLNFLVEKLYELIKKQKENLEEYTKNNEIKHSHAIEIDISNHNVGPKKTLELNHLNTKGIGGLVGNLLQFDEKDQTFKFNTYDKSLGENANYMLEELKKLTKDDLTKYTIKVRMNNFPRTSFNVNQNDKNLAEEFFCKLWFYTNQATEEIVEKILKTEIDDHYIEKQDFRVHSDAIFLRFHDEIQKWWKSQSQARYLTKTDTIFDEAKKDIVDSPMLTVLNIMLIRTLKKFDVEFDIDIINSMNLDYLLENKKILNILTDSVILSAAKIIQLVNFQTKYTFINLDYVHILPENEYSKMIDELRETEDEEDKREIKAKFILVIICETSVDKRLQDTLRRIIQIFNGKIIIITDKPLPTDLYLNQDYVVFKDEKVNLTHLNNESQAKILNESKVIYQGQKVKLKELLMDEDSKSLIRAKLLWSILNKDKIEIGHSLNSHKYDEIKNCYVNRSLLLDGDKYEVNTLNDIDDQIVIITSKPCVGKTILLTHLSLQTKEIDPQPWIVLINMSAHSNDFADWPEKNIQLTNIMRFLCKAALRKTDNIKNLEFIEVTSETIDVNVNNINSDDISYELEWFIYLYNRGKVIFLFDGFDRICPHHKREGIELFKALKRANKQMWITSNCYNINILENEFGASYRLEKLTINQQESFLNRFWKTNLKLEKLNHQQCENITLFFDFIMRLCNSKRSSFFEERPIIPLLSIPLHMVYLTAADYFKNEINNLSSSYLRETLKKKWRLNNYTAVDRYLRQPAEEESLELSGTPLHMYIAANYFEIQIKDKFDLHLNKDEIRNKANVYLNTVLSYERFLKCNLRHVCELENKDIEKEQDKLRDDFFETHKILGLYAICKDSDISKLLTEPEIHRAKSIIKKVASGEIKTHLIDCVVDDIPRFYNLIFAEYFIAEFAADLLKRAIQGNMEHLQIESLCNFIVNIVIIFCPPGVRNAFDYKLKYDPELAEVASNEKCDRIIFDLILKQNENYRISGVSTESSLNIAINEGLVNLSNLLLKGARRYVDKDNVDGFVSVLKSGTFLFGVANPSWRELTDTVLHCIKDVDGEKLMEVVNSNQVEGAISRAVTSVCGNTEFGQNLQEKIKSEVCEPIKQLTEKIVATSSNNENLTTLVELLPHHLPSIVNSIFGMK